MIATFAWGRDAVVSHRAAASLWELAGFERTPVELIVPPGRNRARSEVVHRIRALPGVDRGMVDGIPVTAPARTLIDVASVAALDRVEEALDDALRRGLVSLPLRWRLREVARRGRPGIAVMRSLIEARAPAAVPQSVFETRLFRGLKRARLPLPLLQYRVRDRGKVVAVVDFAYPHARLAIEADGFRWHSGRTAWERDRTRSNALLRLGWRVIHVTWPELEERLDDIVATIGIALGIVPLPHV